MKLKKDREQIIGAKSLTEEVAGKRTRNISCF